MKQSIFRNIRRKLLGEGKLVRYSTYAIGEVVLIIVGILFALKINDWNEAQADRVLELEYVARLKSDLRQDIIRFEGFLNGRLNLKKKVLESFGDLQSGVANFDRSIFNTKGLEYSQTITLPETQSSTIKEMESTGNFRLIQNTELRTSIEDYYAYHQLLWGITEKPVGDYKKIFSESIPGSAFLNARVSRTEMSEEGIQTGLRNLMSHPGFKVAVNSEIHYTGEMIYWLQRFRIRGDALLARIEEAYPEEE